MTTDRTALTERIEEAIGPLVERAGLELFGVQYRSEQGRMLLRVIADLPDGGVTLEALAALSRNIGDLLDTDEVLDGRYQLECSSPGVERPLLRPRHFQSAVGQRVRVTTEAAIEGRRRWRGVLTAADDERVTLHDDEVGAREFAHDVIAEAKTEFDAAAALASHGRR